MGALERGWGGLGLSRDKDVGLSARVGFGAELWIQTHSLSVSLCVCLVWPYLFPSFHSGQGLRGAVLFG